MKERSLSRRQFLGRSALGATAGAALLANPARVAAQAVGAKTGDLPDLTIKEVKIFVLDRKRIAGGPTNQGYTLIASIVTNSGIEGNYTLATRYWHPNWSNLGWLEFAQGACVGKSVLDLPQLTSQWVPEKRRVGQSSYASAIDNCLWDILGKAVGLPVYRILGAYRNRVMAYASSQHHATVDEFVQEVQVCKAQGFNGYKIHPPSPGGGHNYKLDIEVCRAVRKVAGDDFVLMCDPVGVYTRDEAIKVGRAIQDLGFIAYEDPLPTKDIEGLAELARDLDVPLHIGEFLVSIYDYAEYLRRGAVDVVRFVVDNIGGISAGLKVAHAAECFELECAPHNWGEVFDHAVHFHLELAMPNNAWFEMTVPQGTGDRPYMKDTIRIAPDGYVYAPTKPGLGYELDRDVLDKLTVRIDR